MRRAGTGRHERSKMMPMVRSDHGRRSPLNIAPLVLDRTSTARLHPIDMCQPLPKSHDMHRAIPAMVKRLRAITMCTAVAFALGSCGKPDISKPFSLIGAQSGGETVSAARVKNNQAQNESVMRAPSARPALPAPVRAADQELLAQEALQGRLDRDAQVAQAIEGARRQILAQAYVERTVPSAPRASPREIGKFYAENPALFRQRRLYRVLELVVVVAPAQLGALQGEVARAKDLAEVVRWLDFRKLSFEATMSSRTAEQIPMNILQRLFVMHDGQIAMFPTALGASVLRLEQVTEAPLSEKQAGAAIAKYLFNRRRLELVQVAVAKLREKAKLDRDGTETGRPATVTQVAARTPLRTAEPGVARDSSDIARLR